MQFDSSFLDQLRSSLSLVDLVSSYVTLKKQGQNHAGLCPFHSEKTPSFLVNDSKQIFKCFGCGQGGDAIQFVTLIEGFNFPEAVEHLAQRYGVPLPRGKMASPEQSERRQQYLHLMESAERFFQSNLRATGHQVATDYLERRQITSETIERFGIGYAPGGNGLLQLLRRDGFREQDAEVCGLLKFSDSGEPYDKFRNRVTFPIRDLSGRVIAFGGRILGDGMPKYLNSPETPLYHKSSNLYGLDLSRDEIRRRNVAILVEGYFDCIVPYQFGFRNVVASLGTSLTELQAKVLRRYTDSVVINYDPDTAGVNASIRAIEIFLDQGCRVSVTHLPEEMDPDTFLCRHGAEAYSDALRSSLPALDFLLQHFRSQFPDPAAPRAKQETILQMVPFLMKISENIERAEYVSQVASKVNVDENLIRLEMRKRIRRSGRQNRELPWVSPSLTRVTQAERALLQAILEEETRELAFSLIELELFEGLRSWPLLSKVFESRELNHQISILYLRDRLEDKDDQDLLETVALSNAGLPVTEETILESVRALRRKQFEGLSRRLQEEIATAEKEGADESRIEDLLTRKEELRRKMRLELE